MSFSIEMAQGDLAIVVPVKRLSESKLRLSPALPAEARGELTLAMLHDVLTAVVEGGQELRAVVTTDRQVEERAEALGFAVVHEEGDDLNSAVDDAVAWARLRAAGRLLILPSDVPMCAPKDVAEMARLSVGLRGIVISPSRECEGERGTSALVLSPPWVIEPSFGRDSFVRHREAAALAGVECRVYESPRLALDVDTVEDLEALRFGQTGGCTARWLRLNRHYFPPHRQKTSSSR